MDARIHWIGTPAVGYEPKPKAKVILKSFEDLGKHMQVHTKSKKPTPTAMLTSVTFFIDSHIVMRNGDVRLAKVLGPNNIKRTKVKRPILHKYAKGNEDGSITITGKYSIGKVVLPLINV